VISTQRAARVLARIPDGSVDRLAGERHDTRQRASPRRRDEKEEFMMRADVQRLGGHVIAALLGQVTS
jgi:hypothetical protein